MIKNVIFDLGKVLIGYDFDIFFHKIGYQAGERQLDEAEEIIYDFESGKMNKYHFLEELKKIYGFSLSYEEFETIWCDLFWKIDEMITLAKRISATHNVFIFSNTDEMQFPYIWQKFPELHFFSDNLMLSYQLGDVKPHKKVYERALNKFGLKAPESVFIDDRPKNIHVATEMGFHGHIYTHFTLTKSYLEDKLKIKL